MISNKISLLICTFIVVVSVNGNVFAAGITGKTGNKDRGSSTSGKSADVVDVDDDERGSDYPTGWYYYGNPAADLYSAPSVYESYYNDFYAEDDMQEASASSPVYIEKERQQIIQSSQSSRSSDTDYWNYCPDKKAYYPYVSDCPSQWQKTGAQPLGQESGYWYYCKDPAGYYPYVSICNGNWQKIIPY